MTVYGATAILKSAAFSAALMGLFAMLSGCSGEVVQPAKRDTTAMDGRWRMTFTSETPVGLRGVRCVDGSGSFTVLDGKVTGETFQNTKQGMRAVGAMEGNFTATEGGFFISLIRSQDGRNAFAAKARLTASGAVGTWEDINKCAGTFVASRV